MFHFNLFIRRQDKKQKKKQTLFFSMRQFAAKLAAVPKHDAVVISSDDDDDQQRSKPSKVFFFFALFLKTEQKFHSGLKFLRCNKIMTKLRSHITLSLGDDFTMNHFSPSFSFIQCWMYFVFSVSIKIKEINQHDQTFVRWWDWNWQN